jgi:hypothetical protein
LSYQLPDLKEGGKGERYKGRPSVHEQRLSAILSQNDGAEDEKEKPRSFETTYESRTRNNYIGEAGIRRLVVVHEGRTSALCL